jgi:hypothetical protein
MDKQDKKNVSSLEGGDMILLALLKKKFNELKMTLYILYSPKS